MPDPLDPADNPAETGRAADRPADLLPEIYNELRELAAAYLRKERVNHTLEPTALVNEAYLRLNELQRMHFRDKTHFFGVAAGAIRRVLVDHARSKAAAKRGGGWHQVTLSAVGTDGHDEQIDLMELEEALRKLSALDEKLAEVVELRFFAGLTIEQTAKVVGYSTTTVKERWEFARAWLRRELATGGSA
jgi:RNA polymerase sigma factor (TIGR02999 family)